MGIVQLDLLDLLFFLYCFALSFHDDVLMSALAFNLGFLLSIHEAISLRRQWIQDKSHLLGKSRLYFS